MPEWKPRNTARARELRNRATPAERALWRYLARSQLGAKFSRQMPVGPFYADFLCREHKLAIELDGFSHDIQPERDATRDRWFTEHGYRVLRFTNEACCATRKPWPPRSAKPWPDGPTPNPSRKREGD